MTCQHTACDCDVPIDREGQFCSTQCETALTLGKPGDPCPCGHPGCHEARDAKEGGDPLHVP